MKGNKMTQKQKKTFWEFIAGFFRDNEPESMNRVLSLLFGCAAVAFGIIMLIHIGEQKTVLDRYEFWISVVFAFLALVNKNIQKLAEIALQKIQLKVFNKKD